MMPTRRVRLIHVQVILTGLFLSLVVPARAEPTLNTSAAYYLDQRGFATASIGLSTDRLPLGLSLWGFTDVHGDHNSDSLALKRWFSEYRLSHTGIGSLLSVDGLAIQIESNFISGSGNDVTRAGLVYRHNVGANAWLQWRAFPVESDSDGGQLSLIYSLAITETLTLGGFADYNVRDNLANRWVVEPELRLKLSSNLSALLEYRYNQFEQSSAGISGSSIAVGLRYRFSQ